MGFSKDAPPNMSDWYYKIQPTDENREWWLATDAYRRFRDSQGYCCECEKNRNEYSLERR